MENWRPLLVRKPHGLGYPDDFDRNREYEFKRDDGEPVRLKLADQSPYFNVAGLMWLDEQGSVTEQQFAAVRDWAARQPTPLPLPD